MAYAPPSDRAKWLAPALGIVVVAFLLFSLPPYFTGDPARSRVPATATPITSATWCAA